MSRKKTFIISLGIIAISVLVTSLVFFTEPEAKQEGATKKTAMLVEVIRVQRSDYQPTIVATGNVQAAKDIILSPRVDGEITRISQDFSPGAFIKRGQILLQIDPSDYQNTLKLRKSDLQLAKADLRVEMGRQDVAEKDYELVGEELSPENKALVLREPQLESAKANVDAAKAAVRQAKLDLSRTTIRAPFDAHIITRNANVGSQVTAGSNLGRIVGMDEYWVVANVPVSKINYLSFSESNDETGAEVKITHDSNWPPGYYRTGKLFRLVGALDNQTRLARVIIKVKDPLVQNIKRENAPPLMIGAFVQVHIKAEEIPNVVRLSRDYLRKEDNVWVMKEGKLEIREVNIVFEDADYAYISEGLEHHEQVITTNLATVVEGSPLRQEGQSSAGDSLKTGGD